MTMTPNQTKRFTKETIVAAAEQMTNAPAVRDYTEQERRLTAVIEIGANVDPYKKFCAFMVRSWINGSRYCQAMAADTITAEHFTYLTRANQTSRDNFVAATAEQGTIDPNQAMYDARQAFIGLAAIEY